jgi:hypothetical protein
MSFWKLGLFTFLFIVAVGRMIDALKSNNAEEMDQNFFSRNRTTAKVTLFVFSLFMGVVLLISWINYFSN